MKSSLVPKWALNKTTKDVNLGLFNPITKDDVDGWDLTYNENHWSNFDIAKHFVENVIVPYHQA
jgi:hypothetical protein